MTRTATSLSLALLLLFAAACSRGTVPADDKRPAAAPAPTNAPANAPANAPTNAESLPPGHPPIDRAQGAAPSAADAEQADPGVSWTVPAGWTSSPPSGMRIAQYAAGGAACNVFAFGPGQGGAVQDNVERWRSQFAGPAGAPPAAKVAPLAGALVKTTLVEIAGEYQGAMAMGAGKEAPPAQKDALLLGAIVEGPRGSVFFKLVGPRAAVEAQRAAFKALVASIRPSGAKA